jgi:predicted trehalose synthase
MSDTEPSRPKSQERRSKTPLTAFGGEARALEQAQAAVAAIEAIRSRGKERDRWRAIF